MIFPISFVVFVLGGMVGNFLVPLHLLHPHFAVLGFGTLALNQDRTMATRAALRHISGSWYQQPPRTTRGNSFVGHRKASAAATPFSSFP